MNFSQGHSGTKGRDVNRACFPKEKHQRAQRSKKFEISGGIENFEREWKLRASHPPRPYFLWGNRDVEIEIFARDQKFRSRSNFLIVGPSGKDTRIHKNVRNSWTFRFGPFFGLVCRGDSWLQLRSYCLWFVFSTYGGGTVSKTDQTEFLDGGNRTQKRTTISKKKRPNRN